MVSENLMLQVMGGFVVFVGLLFASSGSWFGFKSIKSYQTSARRDEFVPVQARVLGSELGRKSGQTVSAGTTGGGTSSYVPKIEYEFTVAGQTYTSDSVYPGTDWDIQDRNTAESLVDRYSQGDVVEAHYHPDDPTETFLENESVATKSVATLAFSGFVTLLGVGLIVGGTLWIL
jgi:hypothetical protein